jgi:PPP family 3-phenylpropionic acid transporter
MRARIPFGPVPRLTLVLSLIFAGNGMALPFLGRWLESEHGLSGVEIAAVVSTAQLARILIGPPLGAWADGFADRRTPLGFLVAASAALYAAFFAVDGFWALLATSFLAQTLAQAATPLIEGAMLRRAMAGGSLSYGVARSIGSAAFIAANVLGGAMVARFGVDVVGVWLVGAISAAACGALFALSPDPAEDLSAGGGFRKRLRAALALFRKPSFAVPVAAAGLIQCSHAFYYGFSTLVWVRQGFSDALIGWMWAFGAIIEIGLLWTLPRVEKRFTPEALIALGGAGAALRWGVLAFSPPAWIIWPVQALHALSFAAAHVGALKLVQREAPAHLAGVAQTLYAAVASGTLAGLAMLLAGALYDTIGALGYLPMAVFAAVGVMLMLTRLTPATRLVGEQTGASDERTPP